jgi:hypothetical protein
MADLEAYQAFMLRGKGAPVTPVAAKPRDSLGSSGKKNKSEVAVMRAFQGRLQEWKETDTQLEAVVGSIANLRDRIWWETRQRAQMESRKPWEECCFRPSLVSALTLEDMQLALTYDLLQHEKMMAAGRNLITSLAQAQDGMGRRLDEWMMMNLESPLSQQGLICLDLAQDVYGLLAEKLYCRQDALRLIFDSSHDGLVSKEGVEGHQNPRVVARTALSRWQSKDSVMTKLVDEMLAA